MLAEPIDVVVAQHLAHVDEGGTMTEAFAGGFQNMRDRAELH